MPCSTFVPFIPTSEPLVQPLWKSIIELICGCLGCSFARLALRLSPGHRFKETIPVADLLHQLWSDERGQDIAEYAVMLAVSLVIVIWTVRLIGSNANTVFSQVGSAIQ